MYYAPIRITGRDNIPQGPVLFVANHQDSLLDPVLVASAARRNVRFMAKATLFDVPVLGTVMHGLGMIPAYRAQDDAAQVKRNLEILDRAAEALVAGESVGVFPEGKSHDELCVAEVKSGAARMAQKAVTLGARLTLVPIGMNFERKEGFRTALWIQIGKPLNVAAFLEAYPHEKQGQRALTQEIVNRLREVALHLDDTRLAPLLEELEFLVPAPGLKSRGPLGRLQSRKRVADALNHFYASDRPWAEAAANQVQAFTAALAAEGVHPGSPVMRFRRLRLTLRLLRDGAGLILAALPILAGWLHHVVPYVVSRRLAARWNDGRSTLALMRLGFGLPLMVLCYAGVWLTLRAWFLPWVAWTWLLLMPWCGFLALKYLRRLRRGGSAALAQTRLFFRPEKLRALRQQQDETRALVASLAVEYNEERPAPPPLEEPWTWGRIGRGALRWTLWLLVAGLLWTAYAHWRRTQEPLAGGGLDLAAVTPAALTAMLDGDETMLHRIITEAPRLEMEAAAMAADFKSGKRSWYAQADNDALRQLLRRYVSYRAALVRMIWRYQQSAAVQDERLQARTFLCACAAGTTLASVSLGFTDAFAGSPEAARKLNEAEPAWDIPAGVFDTARRSLASGRNRRALAEAFARYHAYPFAGVLPPGTGEGFHGAILGSEKRLAAAAERITADRMTQPLRDARDEGREVIYSVQTMISTWMGDTKLREPGAPLIAAAQVEELRGKLQPGDIFLERRNWYVSNAFLPGYWPHAALYVGSPDELKKLGLEQDPRVQQHWAKLLRPDAGGHACVVLESVSEGVVFTSLEHSIGEADSVALLRPRLAPQQIREAIARAFSHAGKPYDFEFDFFSSDKLVCTELVYRAYDGPIQFPLKKIMGTTTLPAIEFVRKYAAERNSPAAQFAFVCCLQGDAGAGRASFVDEAGFIRTLELPGSDLLMGN